MCGQNNLLQSRLSPRNPQTPKHPGSTSRQSASVAPPGHEHDPSREGPAWVVDISGHDGIRCFLPYFFTHSIITEQILSISYVPFSVLGDGNTKEQNKILAFMELLF